MEKIEHIRKRKSGNYEVRVHRDRAAHRLGTYKTLEEAILVRDKFISINKKIHPKLKHGMRHSKIYKVWINMHSRCRNPNVKQYGDYGGRGILVCERWNDFELFYEDMRDGYDEGLQIDRIDNNKGYFKENCRWTTRNINCSNRREYHHKYKTGVSKNKNKTNPYISSIKINGSRYYLGCFQTECAAYEEYRKVYFEWFGRYPSARN